MLIIPPQIALYMALAPEEKISYAVAGPKADAAFEAGAAGFQAKGFRGCGIFTSEPFEVSDDQDSVQMCVRAMRRLARAPPRSRAPVCLRRLTRNSQIGEFYTLMPPQVDPGDKKRHTCDILIYGAPLSAHARGHAHAHAPTSASVADEESDKHVRISWKDALEATMLEAGGAPGAKIDVTDAAGNPVNMNGGVSLANWLVKAQAISDYNADTNNAALGKTPAFGDIDPDIRIVVCRPFSAPPPVPARTPCAALTRLSVRAAVEHMMHSAILAVSGRETGATCAISQFERRLCDRRRLWRFPCAQCSARRTCSSRPTPRSRPSRATTPGTSSRSSRTRRTFT